MILSTTVFPEQHLQTTVFKVNIEMRLGEGCEIIRNLPMSDQRRALCKYVVLVYMRLFHLDQEPPL